jgi:hypothetical protein
VWKADTCLLCVRVLCFPRGNRHCRAPLREGQEGLRVRCQIPRRAFRGVLKETWARFVAAVVASQTQYHFEELCETK